MTEEIPILTEWSDIPDERKIEIAQTHPAVPVEIFTGMMLRTVTETTVHDARKTPLVMAMLDWTEAQLERFNLEALPSFDLQVTFPQPLYTKRILLSALLDRLFEIEAIDEARYTEWTGKLPLLPDQDFLIR